MSCPGAPACRCGCHRLLTSAFRSADKAIQQFGRSHRSNQASAPIYRILLTELGGERRFAASAAKRLLSLGALLRGDRNALGAGASLKQFDIETTVGGLAMKRTIYDAMAKTTPLPGTQLADASADELRSWRANARKALVSVGLAVWSSSDLGFRDSSNRTIALTDKNDVDNVPRFLNRMLGLSIADQKALFGHFSETFDVRACRSDTCTFITSGRAAISRPADASATLSQAVVGIQKSRGLWDDGIVDLRAPSIIVAKGFPRRIHTCPTSGAETHVLKLRIDRGFTFARAQKDFDSYKEADRVHGGASCDGAVRLLQDGGQQLRGNGPATHHPRDGDLLAVPLFSRPPDALSNAHPRMAARPHAA